MQHATKHATTFLKQLYKNLYSLCFKGDEIQEVTAEFTADEQENKKGIVGFSVTDEDNEKPDYEEVSNGDVNWDAYRKRALQRPEHTYVNVKDINNET